MKATITAARKACEAVGARQVVVIAFDGSSRFAVVSYGETAAECAAVKPLCNAIADGIRDGLLPAPQRREPADGTVLAQREEW